MKSSMLVKKKLWKEVTRQAVEEVEEADDLRVKSLTEEKMEDQVLRGRPVRTSHLLGTQESCRERMKQ